MEAKRVKWQEFCDGALDLGCELYPGSIQIGKQLFRGKIMSMYNGLLQRQQPDAVDAHDDVDDNIAGSTSQGMVEPRASSSSHKSSKSIDLPVPAILKVARFGGNIDMSMNLFGRIRNEEIQPTIPRSILERLASENSDEFSHVEDVGDLQEDPLDVRATADDIGTSGDGTGRRRKSSVSNNKYPPETIVQVTSL